MTADEIKIIGWILAVTIAGFSASWLILVMQAFFHDKRIGFACVFGGASAALVMAISESASRLLLIILGLVNIVLIGIFIAQNFRRPSVYAPAFILSASIISGLWIWQRLDEAGLLSLTK